MGRNPVRADHAGNSPGTVVRREFAPHWVAGKGAQRLPCLGLEDIEAHGLAFLRSTSGLRAADDARHRAASITSAQPEWSSSEPGLRLNRSGRGLLSESARLNGSVSFARGWRTTPLIIRAVSQEHASRKRPEV